MAVALGSICGCLYADVEVIWGCCKRVSIDFCKRVSIYSYTDFDGVNNTRFHNNVVFGKTSNEKLPHVKS